MDEKTGNRNDGRSFEEIVLARFDALDERLSGMDERLANLEQKVSDIDQRLSSLDQRVGNLEQQVSRMDQRLGDMDERLSTLEATVDTRLKETRPIWEMVLTRLDSIDGELKVVNRKIRVLHDEMLNTRAGYEELHERVEKLESERAP